MEAGPIEQAPPVAATAPPPPAPVPAPMTLRGRVRAAQRSDTGQAAGLAVATIVQQLLAVAFTVVFTRILGTGGYGSLAALINLTVILLVPGSALQVAAARRGTLRQPGRGAGLAAPPPRRAPPRPGR